jgi:drug/metabolite transporter (DMT)-like permease
MSLLTLAVPVVAAVTAAVFLDERIVGLQVLGMAIVVCALGTVVLRETGRAPDTLPGGADLPPT